RLSPVSLRAVRRLSRSGLSYEIHGRGYPCLTLHGGPGMSSTLWPALRPIARDAQLVTYDHRGHGRSHGQVPLRGPLQRLADDATRLLDELEIRRADVLGHSNGGFIALHLALRHPDRVRRLVLVDTAASGRFRPVSQRNARERATPAILRALDHLWSDRLADDAAFGRAWRTVQPLYFHHPTSARLALALRGIRFTLEARRRILPTYRAYDLRARLGAIRAPTLVAVGRFDWITPPGFAEELAAGISRARLVVFERSGHLPFIEERDRFAKAVGAFLRG
ncbi:MAG: alpha/beta fold hydrolase, partial [Chloroflexota bacterium]|nr:alpha/beta fold hydrolase [Chloroflexota bacterium]